MKSRNLIVCGVISKSESFSYLTSWRTFQTPATVVMLIGNPFLAPSYENSQTKFSRFYHCGSFENSQTTFSRRSDGNFHTKLSRRSYENSHTKFSRFILLPKILPNHQVIIHPDITKSTYHVVNKQQIFYCCTTCHSIVSFGKISLVSRYYIFCNILKAKVEASRSTSQLVTCLGY